MTQPVLSAYGRLGADPRSHQTKSGTAMASCSLAVTLACRADENVSTWWLALLAFGRQAEDLLRCQKGDMAGVVGRLQLSRWEKSDGETVEQHQLLVDQIVTARTVRPNTKRKSNGDNRQQQAARQFQQPAPAPATAGFDDEIPF